MIHIPIIDISLRCNISRNNLNLDSMQKEHHLDFETRLQKILTQ